MKDKLQQWLKDVNYDHKFIWSDDGYMIAEIRGWGMLKHMFPTPDEASDFQDKVGKFIAEAINEKIERLNHIHIKTK